MSNKLKTIPAHLLEKFISEKVSEYIDEECECEVSNLDTPNIDSEAHIALHDEREMTFNVKLTYKES